MRQEIIDYSPDKPGSPDKSIYETKQFNRLFDLAWRFSFSDPGGTTTEVIRPIEETYWERGRIKTRTLGLLPSITLNLQHGIEQNAEQWQNILSRLLINPKEKHPELTVREPLLRTERRDITLASSIEEEIVLQFSYTYMSGTADDQPSKFIYPTDVNSGTPQIHFGIFEIFSTQEEKLRKFQNSMKSQTSKEAKIFIQNLRNEIEDPELKKNVYFIDILPHIEEIPTSIISIIERTATKDMERGGVIQPVNYGGILIYEMLNNEVHVFRLAPWVKYNSWERLSDDNETKVLNAYVDSEKLLEKSFRILSNTIANQET